MVLLAVRGSAACQLLDHYGRPIGMVKQPASDHIVGQGAGTVLLSRSPGRPVLVQRAAPFTRELDLITA
jgi:hypothetical protein